MIGQVWNERRFDLIEEFYIKDVLHYIFDISSKPGLESVREVMSSVLDAYHDLAHTIDDEMIEGDNVVNRRTIKGDPYNSKAVL